MLMKVVRVGRFLPLFVIVLLVSTGMTFTTLLLGGSLATLLGSAGASNNVVVVSSGNARLPETGALKASVAGDVSAVEGVEAVSPEVLAPVSFGGTIAVLRGVDQPAFDRLQHPTLLQGGWGTFSRADVVVGEALAGREGVRVGARLALVGLLANASADATVVGVMSAGFPFDDELLAPLPLARMLRGLPNDSVTLVRFSESPQGVDPAALAAALGAGKGGGGGSSAVGSLLQQFQLSPTSSLVSVGSLQGSPSLSATRVLSSAESVLRSLALVVLLTSLLAVYFVVATTMRGEVPTTGLLRDLGADWRRVALAWGGVAASAAVAAGAAGVVVAYALAWGLGALGQLRFFFHALQVPVDPVSVAVAVAGPAAAALVSVVLVARPGALGRTETTEEAP